MMLCLTPYALTRIWFGNRRLDILTGVAFWETDFVSATTVFLRQAAFFVFYRMYNP